MKKAISSYLPATWASDISVHDWSPEQLFVMGTQPVVYTELQSFRDPFLRYLSSVQSEFAQNRTGPGSPHIIFANANSDGALRKFVREFGPVAGTEVVEDKVDQRQFLEEPGEVDWSTRLGALQDLATLRVERRTYAAALGLLAELRRGETAVDTLALQRHITDIADGVRSWPEQWQAERSWRISHNFAPVPWHFDSDRRDLIWHLKADVLHPEPQPQNGSLPTGTKDLPWSLVTTEPHRAGHLVLCALVNAFDTEVRYFGNRPVETLPFGALRFGVRPALYLILKHLYLGSSGVLVCENDRCRRFFESERAGQRFCTPECSQRYRQRKYWAESGSKHRKRRTAKRKKGSVKAIELRDDCGTGGAAANDAVKDSRIRQAPRSRPL